MPFIGVESFAFLASFLGFFIIDAHNLMVVLEFSPVFSRKQKHFCITHFKGFFY